jgi:hypothetical protein
MRVYYLTQSQFAISNIALQRLKIARIADLNDPFELMAIEIRDEQDLSVFKDLKEKLNETKGMLCFSRNWSNPVMWGHYADRHTGIALGFEGKDTTFMPVNYASSPLPISREPDSNLPKPTLAEVSMLLCTKFSDWRYEDEVRVFIALDETTKESGLYFYEFGKDIILREIILGPKCEIPIEKVRKLVEHFTPSVQVIKSSISHGTFRVSENPLASVSTA